MIHRTWLHIRVSRRPRHAKKHLASRFPRRSKPRCWPRFGARDTATCWPSISCCWCAVGTTPRTIAAVLFCARSSVYRTVRAYRKGLWAWSTTSQERLTPPVRTTVLVPTLRRSLLALLKAPPQAYGWCRTRWSCATLALTLQTNRGLTVSAETMRRWLHEVGWVWKRATLVAKDDDPQRVERLARIRYVFEQLKFYAVAGEAGDAVDPRGLNGLHEGDRRQIGGESACQHRLACPWRSQEK